MVSNPKLSYLRLIFKRSRRVAIGTSIFAFLVLFSIYGYFYPVSPRAPYFEVYQPPSSQNILGTDALGRDILAQTLEGARFSLMIGVTAGGLATLIGVVIGGIGGYFGGIVDEATTALTNVVMTVPTLALLIVIASYVRIRSEWLIVLLISVISWAWTARAIRAQVLSLKTREFIDVARQSGLSRTRILIVEVLPNLLAYIVMSFAIQVGSAIIAEAGLSTIGFGPTEVISLGVMLRWAILFQAASTGVWWWILPPGILITSYSLSLLLVKDGLDQIFNPRTRT